MLALFSLVSAVMLTSLILGDVGRVQRVAGAMSTGEEIRQETHGLDVVTNLPGEPPTTGTNRKEMT